MSDGLDDLLRDLRSTDRTIVHAAGTRLLREGEAAVPALASLYDDSSPQVRRSALYLLGRLPAVEVSLETLAAGLRDEDGRVRKTAARALGVVGRDEAVEPLAEALGNELFGHVRTSLILALGAIGTERAATVLASVSALCEGEHDALRKARDRTTVRSVTARWIASGPEVPLCATTPPGLEDIAVAEAREAGLEAAGRSGHGVVRFARETDPDGLSSLRCIHAVRFLLATGESFRGESARWPDGLFEVSGLERWRSWIHCSEETLPYRFVLDGVRVKRKEFDAVLHGVRQRLAPLGLTDSPSRYVASVILESTASAARLWLEPVFSRDSRFDYRRRDVGASIHPVVAASLARLVRRPRSRRVLDVACGSGTLLIERALLGPGSELEGIDISPTAVSAARENVAAAGLSARISIRREDAAARRWGRADEILSNLPFGNRSRTQDRDLPYLYRQIVAGISEQLRPGGLALLYTRNAELVRRALVKHDARLQVVDTRQVQSGGSVVGVWTLERVKTP